jgi:hypothetical protein
MGLAVAATLGVTPLSNVPKERLTDESIKVRQVTHHQFSFVTGSGTEAGRFTLQLMLDQGAAEESSVLPPRTRRSSSSFYRPTRMSTMTSPAIVDVWHLFCGRLT